MASLMFLLTRPHADRITLILGIGVFMRKIQSYPTIPLCVNLTNYVFDKISFKLPFWGNVRGFSCELWQIRLAIHSVLEMA
jgi:hypothetical protein